MSETRQDDHKTSLALNLKTQSSVKSAFQVTSSNDLSFQDNQCWENTTPHLWLICWTGLRKV